MVIHKYSKIAFSKIIRVAFALLYMLAGVLFLTASTSNVLISDDFDTLDTNIWVGSFQRPGVGAWDSSYGSISINNGTVELRPDTYRGGTSLETVDPITISLPMTIRFRLRYQSSGYRATHFRIVLAGSVDARVVAWNFGSTNNLYLFSNHQVKVSGESDPIANLGSHLVSEDTWIDAEMRIYEDRIETQFEGLSTVGYTDMTLFTGQEVELRFGTYDDYSTNGQDVDFVEVITQVDCYIDAPESINENESFDATVTCGELDAAVYGFDFAHSVDPSSPPIAPQSTTYNAGDIFANAGSNILTLINDLDSGYAVTLRDPEPPVSISGTATLGTVTYDTDLPGTAVLNLDSLILGNDIGQAIYATYFPSTSIEILDLPIAAVSGTATRETGADRGVDITLTIDTVAPISPTSTAGILSYAYPEIVALDGLLEADAPGHLYCSQQLNLIDEIVNSLPLITLLAGDVNNDDAINITDGAIIVSARIGDPIDPAYTPDLNEDGIINILDLIHVGRNFGKQQPNLCISS